MVKNLAKVIFFDKVKPYFQTEKGYKIPSNYFEMMDLVIITTLLWKCNAVEWNGVENYRIKASHGPFTILHCVAESFKAFHFQGHKLIASVTRSEGE